MTAATRTEHDQRPLRLDQPLERALDERLACRVHVVHVECDGLSARKRRAEIAYELSVRPPERLLRLATGFRPAGAAAGARCDRAAPFAAYLPASLAWQTVRGVRIATPVAALHKVPLVGPLLGGVERALADAPVARGFGGFLIAVARKVG